MWGRDTRQGQYGIVCPSENLPQKEISVCPFFTKKEAHNIICIKIKECKQMGCIKANIPHLKSISITSFNHLKCALMEAHIGIYLETVKMQEKLNCIN